MKKVEDESIADFADKEDEGKSLFGRLPLKQHNEEGFSKDENIPQQCLRW